MDGKERIEKLIEALMSLNPHAENTGEDAGRKLYDAMWAAACHQTERAARFYLRGSPDGEVYHAMSEALYLYRQDKQPS